MFGDFGEPAQVSHGHLELNGNHVHQCPEPRVIQTGPQPKRVSLFSGQKFGFVFQGKDNTKVIRKGLEYT